MNYCFEAALDTPWSSDQSSLPLSASSPSSPSGGGVGVSLLLATDDDPADDADAAAATDLISSPRSAPSKEKGKNLSQGG